MGIFGNVLEFGYEKAFRGIKPKNLCRTYKVKHFDFLLLLTSTLVSSKKMIERDKELK